MKLQVNLTYTDPGPNNGTEITGKFRYFGSVSKNMEITELAKFRYSPKNFAELGFKVMIKSTFHNNFWSVHWPWFQIYTFLSLFNAFQCYLF